MKIEKIQTSTPSNENKNINMSENESEIFISILNNFILNFNSTCINNNCNNKEILSNDDIFIISNNYTETKNLNLLKIQNLISNDNMEHNLNTLNNNTLDNLFDYNYNTKNLHENELTIMTDNKDNFNKSIDINHINQKLFLLIDEKINNKQTNINNYINSIFFNKNDLDDNINNTEFNEIESKLNKISCFSNNEGQILTDITKTNYFDPFKTQHIKYSFEQKIENIHEIINIVASRIKNIKNENIYELRIVLKPKEFGEINIQVSYSDGKINSTITANNKEVINLLQNNLPTLKEQIKNNEYSYKEININVNVEDNKKDNHERHKQKSKKNYNNELFGVLAEQENL